MKIFLTGATGYIGYNLAMELVSEGHCVHALVRKPSAPIELDHPNIRIFKGDITDINSVKTGIANCEEVYHAVAFTKMQAYNRSRFYATNTDHRKRYYRFTKPFSFRVYLAASYEKNFSALFH